MDETLRQYIIEQFDNALENGWIQGYEASDPALALLGENMPAAHGVVK